MKKIGIASPVENYVADLAKQLTRPITKKVISGKMDLIRTLSKTIKVLHDKPSEREKTFKSFLKNNFDLMPIIQEFLKRVVEDEIRFEDFGGPIPNDSLFIEILEKIKTSQESFLMHRYSFRKRDKSFTEFCQEFPEFKERYAQMKKLTLFAKIMEK